MIEAAILTPEVAPAPTPIAASLEAENPELREYAGALTARAFGPLQPELAEALSGVVISDLGFRTRIRIVGPDRTRWLNGMVSNAIQGLEPGHGNYNFILNAQGKIQGDAYIYHALDGSLLLDTDRSQSAKLLAHLDHFIIMDDVELHPLDEATTGIAIRGPRAAALLDSLGMALQGIRPSQLAPLQMLDSQVFDLPVALLRAYSVNLPGFEVWFHPSHASALWGGLLTAGASPIGIDAVEALRVLEGIPRYGTDISDRQLVQETLQTRALNFTKGCYLGQEIVERIRSRATVHRNLRQFRLEGALPAMPADLRSAGDAAAIGQLTSVARFDLPGLQQTLALGVLRTEALERKRPLEYDGGTAAVLDRPPSLAHQ